MTKKTSLLTGSAKQVQKKVCMDVWTYGFMDGCVDGFMDGLMDV